MKLNLRHSILAASRGNIKIKNQCAFNDKKIRRVDRFRGLVTPTTPKQKRHTRTKKKIKKNRAVKRLTFLSYTFGGLSLISIFYFFFVTPLLTPHRHLVVYTLSLYIPHIYLRLRTKRYTNKARYRTKE